MAALIPAVAYYRKSTDRQEASIPDQRTEVQAYATRHSFQILREYLDEGISGDATEKRMQFQRMLKDAKDLGDFEAVLCWDQDRFGRFDALDAGYWIKPLRDAGVRLETVAQGSIPWDDFAGRIIYTVRQEGKHQFLRDLSRNVSRGMLARAREGKFNGGRCPYGYRDVDGVRVPGDPAHVAVVQWLFRTYAYTPMGMNAMAHDLSARGVPSPHGGYWFHKVIRFILENPNYVGDRPWNRTNEGKYHKITGNTITTRRRRRTRTEINRREDWVVVPNAHEPIIDRKTWQMVQDRLSRNQKPPTTPHMDGGEFLLTGLVVCGHCGRPMVGQAVHHRTKPTPQLVCSHYHAHGRAACLPNRVLQKPLVGVILRKIQADFLNPENLKKLRAEMLRQTEQHLPPPDHANKLRSRLIGLDRKLAQGADRLLGEKDDALVPLLRERLKEVKRQRDETQTELDGMAQQTTDRSEVIARVNRAIAGLGNLHERIEQLDRANLREVLRQTVSRVECWFEHKPYGQKGRVQSFLTRGLIHLRPDLVVVKDGEIGGPIANPASDSRLYLAATRGAIAHQIASVTT